MQRLADYRPPARFHELWRGQVDAMALDEELREQLLDTDRIDEFLAALPDPGMAGHLHACTHTTFSPNVADGLGKTNVIPDRVTIDVDIRTMPGDHTEEVRGHLREALGDLADHVELEVLQDDAASSSRIETPLWDAWSGPWHGRSPRPESTPSSLWDSRTLGSTGRWGLWPTGRASSALGSVAGNSPRDSTETTSGSTSSRWV